MNPHAVLDWPAIESDLDRQGHAVVARLIDHDACDELVALYPREDAFRKRIVMARHGYGRGEYKYFAYPLPAVIADLRTRLYPPLVPVANRWNELMKIDGRFPDDHTTFIERCHAAGQTRPTPLLLQYGAGDFNCLHQDLYGAHVFPLQITILLSQPGRDFSGGEFLMTEQVPRKQSRVRVVPLQKGDAVVFAVSRRPVPSPRGHSKANMRHGVSDIHHGHRHTAGIIFHDAA